MNVSDPELIARLEAKRNPTPSGGVNDADLVARLDAKRNAVTAPVQQPQEEGSMLPGWLQAGLSMGTGMIAEPVAGAAGVAASLLGGVDSGVDTINKVRDTLTYSPKDQAGQQALQGVGEFFKPVADAMEGVNQTLGDTAYDLTGSEALAAAAYTAPTAALTAIGMKSPKLIKAGLPAAKAKKLVQRSMLQHPEMKYLSEVADVKLNAAGNVVPDLNAQKMISSGFSRNATSVITNSTPETKAYMRRMFDTFEKSKASDMFELTNSMNDEIGKAITKRFEIIGNRRKAYGAALDKYVNGKAGSQIVDINAPIQSFIDDLGKSFDVKIIQEGGKWGIKETGDLSLRKLSSTRTLFDDVIEKLNKSAEGGRLTLKDAHKLKKTIDELIDSDTAEKAGFQANAQKKLLALRGEVNRAIGEVDSRYAGINQNLASSIEAMKPFAKYAKQMGEDSEKAADIVGATFKNLRNDSARSQSLAADLARIEAEVRRGGTFLKDDPKAMLLYKKYVDDYFKITPEELKALGMKPDDAMAAGVVDAGAAMSMNNPYSAVQALNKLYKFGLDKKKFAELAKQKAAGREAMLRALEAAD